MAISIINPSTSGVGGLDTQVQFNDNNVIAGDSGLTYNKTTDTLTVINSVIVPTIRSAITGDIPLVLQPAGTGAFQLQPTNNLPTGGNARGISAVDLQLARSFATQVASGNNSFTVGIGNIVQGDFAAAIGHFNNASSLYSFAVGSQNIASNNGSVSLGILNTVSAFCGVGIGRLNAVTGGLALGRQNTASNFDCVSIGALNNTTSSGCVAIGVENNSSGVYSVSIGLKNTAIGGATAIGISNSASGNASIALGSYANTKLVNNLFCFGSSSFSTISGISQLNIFNISALTTNNTPSILKTDSLAASTTNQLAISNNSCMAFTGIAVATVTGGGDAVSWKFEGTLQRGANASTTALITTVTPTIISQKPGASTWLLTVTADTINGCLAVIFTGETGKTIRVNCTIFGSEVAF